jgi:hypothetical protein
MNKKANTFLFILGGTVFNIITTIFFFLLFLVIFSRFILPFIPAESAAWILPINFVAAIVASFFVYRLAIKIITKKVDLEKYFIPLTGFAAKKR